MTTPSPYLWLIASFLALIPLQRWIHGHLQGLLFLLIRNPALSQGVYTLCFFPGVVVHEGSHWLVARLLGVQVLGVSLIPRRQPDGKIRFGFVEIAQAGRLRSALIGVAPLFFGAASILLLSGMLLDVEALVGAAFQTHWSDSWTQLMDLIRAPDALIWLYLIFAISNTMLPSSADRALFLPVLVGVLILGVIAALIWDLDRLADWVNTWGVHAARFMATAFSFTILVDVTLVIPIWTGEMLLTRLTGAVVES